MELGSWQELAARRDNDSLYWFESAIITKRSTNLTWKPVDSCQMKLKRSQCSRAVNLGF